MIPFKSAAAYYKYSYSRTLDSERRLLLKLSDIEAVHASICDLIHKSQIAVKGGLSFGECLEEIKRRLEK